MIVRNTSGVALQRPEDISWPVMTTASAASLNAAYELLPGAEVDLSENNSKPEIESSEGLSSLISSGALVRVVNGIDVPASLPDGVKDGFADYNNASGSITLSPGVWTTLTNDGAGAFTNTNYLPPGVARLMDTSNGELDFSDLDLGDEIEIRQDVTVTPIVNGAQVEIRIQLGTGGVAYYLTHSTAVLNQGGGVDYPLIQFLRVYLGDANTANNPGVIQIRCTEQASVTNNGSYISVKKRS